MAIPLGRSLTDPNLVLSQILVTVAAFFMSLGVVAYTIAVVSFLAFTPSSESHSNETLWNRMQREVRVPVVTLFSPYSAVDTVATIGSEMRFLLLHGISSLVVTYPVALVIQRRKFVLDFTATIYFVYFCASWAVCGHFPTSLWWWVTVLGSAVLMYSMLLCICGHREMMDIGVGSSVVSRNDTSAIEVKSVAGDGGIRGNSKGREEEMKHINSKGEEQPEDVDTGAVRGSERTALLKRSV